MIRKVPIGKQVRSAVYVHRDYAHLIVPNNIWADAIEIGLIKHVDFEVVKWDKHTNKVSFIYCPEFSTKFEPTVEAVITVDLNKGTRRKRKYKNNNPPIYHHTWLMVGDDYYDSIFISRGRIRSAEIEEVIKKYDIDKRRIGFKRYWEDIVMPIILRERYSKIV